MRVCVVCCGGGGSFSCLHQGLVLNSAPQLEGLFSFLSPRPVYWTPALLHSFLVAPHLNCLGGGATAATSTARLWAAQVPPGLTQPVVTNPFKDGTRPWPAKSFSVHQQHFKNKQKGTPSLSPSAHVLSESGALFSGPVSPSDSVFVLRFDSLKPISTGMESPVLICCSNKSQTADCTERALSHYAPHETARQQNDTPR